MLGVNIAIHRPLAARDPMNISWHDPELYYFLTLLAGIAALLASLYEPGRLKRAKPQDAVDQQQVKPLPHAVPLDRGQQDVGPAAAQRDRSLPTEEKHVREKIDESPRPAGEQFSRLCENVKDLSPKEQARRMKAEVPVGNVASSWRRLA
jgi:hypothetical protein